MEKTNSEDIPLLSRDDGWEMPLFKNDKAAQRLARGAMRLMMILYANFSEYTIAC